MKSITQDMKYRYSLMKYCEKYGVSRASRKYNKSRSYIYFWKKRFDGTLESLACESRKPHHLIHERPVLLGTVGLINEIELLDGRSYLSKHPQILVHRRPAQPAHPCQFRHIHLSFLKGRIMLQERCRDILLCGLRSSNPAALRFGIRHP